VAGFEYYNAQAKVVDLLSGAPPDYDRKWDSWALFANASYSIGKLTILPGIRHDKTGIAGDNNSYSIGATYQLAESTTLRAYAGQGFSLPTLTNVGNLQKIKTVQGGIETGAVPHLWLKGTYYYNTLRNSQSAALSFTNQTRQGFELEARTTPLFNTSLAAGYTFLYATDSDTGTRLKTDSSQSVPPHLVKLSAIYNNKPLGLTGTLTGNFVYWLAAPGSTTADQGMIWNLHLNWKIKPKSDLSPELFFSGHNLFNGLQTTDTELTKNAGRWFEGGVRLRF
jgi:vitamin B12 transporter